MYKRLNRRQFLRTGALLGATLTVRGIARPAALLAQDSTQEATGGVPMYLDLTGAIQQIHDPVAIKADDAYYVFCTGNGIPIRKSTDLIDWSIPFPPSIFGNVPAWAKELIPGATNIWAPDISFYNGKYQIYYSVSTFGSNRSVIGLVTNTTLDSKADGYKWEDQGLVIESPGGGNYNCIDANFIVDADGVPWLVFGSHWSGIKMRRLDPETRKLSTEDGTLYSLASRAIHPRAIEAPFIIYRAPYYYLFVSFDQCCNGANSTYRVMVGRSESITGRYLDRDGIDMMHDGGTQITFPDETWKGPGHNGILQDGDTTYIVHHAYDVNTGAPWLRIAPLVWDDEGWVAIASS
jgi:arabinan endo-1,5-alpha-L-arabinosidase